MKTKQGMFTGAYEELSFYTLAHPDKAFFIHQYIVDAQTAQTADAATKPISLLFSLVGLFLAVEKGYSGKQVQDAHLHLARNKSGWPAIGLPESRGAITAVDVLLVEAGEERDRMIRRWCASVWGAYKEAHACIAAFRSERLPH